MHDSASAGTLNDLATATDRLVCMGQGVSTRQPTRESFYPRSQPSCNFVPARVQLLRTARNRPRQSRGHAVRWGAESTYIACISAAS